MSRSQQTRTKHLLCSLHALSLLIDQLSVEYIEFETSAGRTGEYVHQEAGKSGLKFWE